MKSTRRLSWVPLLLLLFPLTQMLTSLIVFAGVFIQSSEALISPFLFCLVGQDGGLSCGESDTSGAAPETNINIPRVTVILCLYAPLVLMSFALLALLLAAYGEDRGTLWFSAVCQAAASLLTLIGITTFVGLYWSYVSLAGMTVWYYTCVAVCAELAATAAFTCVSGTRLAAHWE